MLTLATTTKFRKDYKRLSKRGYDMRLLENVVDSLLKEKPLEARFKDHPLVGNYIGFRECHIQNDWLLIYKISHEKLILTLTSTGTHSDLFNE